MIRTQNSTHIQQQVNIENANFTTSNPYQDATTGQLYFQHGAFDAASTLDNALNDSSNSSYTLSDTLQTDVDITVTGMIARTSVSQIFTNSSNEWVDALYVFPLPENAAVDHLMIQVDERKIEGQIKPKQEAKKIFEQAQRAGKKASLVVQRRPNLFTNNIANIGPGESIRINIEYQQTLQYTDNGYSLRFPLGVTPRFAPSDASAEQFDTAILTSEGAGLTANSVRQKKQQLGLPHNRPQATHELQQQGAFGDNISISVNLNTGTQLQHIQSEHHTIETALTNDNKYLVTLGQGPVKMQDFVLTWQPELGSNPSSAHFSQFVNGNEYGMIVLYPPLPDEQVALDREVIFVLDTSGSMSGEAIVQAKQALAYAVDDLSTRDKFNIIEFNSQAEILWRKTQYADTENKATAFDFIATLTANGGTEMQQALSMALLSEADPELFKQILFITDGSVSNELSLMTLIEENLQQARLFTIGIGPSPNSHFMTQAAKSGKGSFTYIGDTRQVRQKMAALLSKINAPALTDIKLNLKGIQHYQDFEMYPSVIADLYKSEPLVLTYKQPMSSPTMSASKISTSQISTSSMSTSPMSSAQKSASQTNEQASAPLTINQQDEPMLVGTYNGFPWHFKKSSATQDYELSTKAKGINVLWAREKIAQLTRNKRHAAYNNVNIPQRSQGPAIDPRHMNELNGNVASNQETAEQAIIQEITQTALEHHIVSEYTSLVAVDAVATKRGRINDDLNQDTLHNLKPSTLEHLSPEQIAARKLKRKDKAMHAQRMIAMQSQHAFTLPQTATSAPLSIIFGTFLLLLSLLIQKLPARNLNRSGGLSKQGCLNRLIGLTSQSRLMRMSCLDSLISINRLKNLIVVSRVSALKKVKRL